MARDFRNVGYDAIFLRFLFHYHFLPDAVVSPYLGFGTGINVDARVSIGELTRQAGFRITLGAAVYQSTAGSDSRPGNFR